MICLFVLYSDAIIKEKIINEDTYIAITYVNRNIINISYSLKEKSVQGKDR